MLGGRTLLNLCNRITHCVCGNMDSVSRMLDPKDQLAQVLLHIIERHRQTTGLVLTLADQLVAQVAACDRVGKGNC